MLVACAVLVLILGMLFQMLGIMSKTWISGQAKAENSVKARAMLDLMGSDIAASLSRADLPAFRDASGNPTPSGSSKLYVFYTRRQGVAPGADPNTIRPLSLISYEYDPADSSLVRRDLPVMWNTPGPFRPDGRIADAGTLGGQPPREISPGIVAFSLKFLAADQTLSDTYLPPDASAPYYDSTVNASAPPYDPLKVSRSVVVSIAVVDAKTLDLLKSTGHLETLQNANFWTSASGGGNMLANWQKAISDGKLSQNGLPAAVAANLLVLERSIPLPAQP
jgi:hypothetical protein